MTVTRPALAAALLIVGLALAGCASPTSAPTGDAPAGESREDAPTGDFCTEFEANGGNGATIAPLQLWLPKEDLETGVAAQLDAMGDIVPPDEIGEEWAAQLAYLDEVSVAVQALGAGESLTGLDALPEDPGSYEAISDHYFDTCG